MVDARQIDHGIAAHARWKYRLFNAVETGKCHWTVEQIRSYTACEFGRWLTSLSPAERQTEHGQEVIRLHQEFHGAAADVLALALQKQTEAAQAAVAPNSPFSLISAHLTAAMSAWKESLGEG